MSKLVVCYVRVKNNVNKRSKYTQSACKLLTFSMFESLYIYFTNESLILITYEQNRTTHMSSPWAYCNSNTQNNDYDYDLH